jgi:hypothetical protein
MKCLCIPVCCLILATGCHHKTTTSSSATTAPSPLTPEQMARKKIPVLNRTLSQQELGQLYTYMNQYNAEHGRFPKTMSELDELSVSRDLPKVAEAVKNGDLVLAGGAGGILAYEKDALDKPGNVLTTDGVRQMTPGELRQKLGM